jgi:hypothetical protein
MTGWREESYNFYLGGPPKLLNADPIVKDLSQRRFLTSMSSGTIIIHCEVLMKGFREQHISGDQWLIFNNSFITIWSIRISDNYKSSLRIGLPYIRSLQLSLTLNKFQKNEGASPRDRTWISPCPCFSTKPRNTLAQWTDIICTAEKMITCNRRKKWMRRNRSTL